MPPCANPPCTSACVYTLVEVGTVCSGNGECFELATCDANAVCQPGIPKAQGTPCPDDDVCDGAGRTGVR
jgi:hypothetical protein